MSDQRPFARPVAGDAVARRRGLLVRPDVDLVWGAKAAVLAVAEEAYALRGAARSSEIRRRQLERLPTRQGRPYKNKAWTDAEAAALRDGVARHGAGKWKAIRQGSPLLSDRRSALAAKWRYLTGPAARPGQRAKTSSKTAGARCNRQK